MNSLTHFEIGSNIDFWNYTVIGMLRDVPDVPRRTSVDNSTKFFTLVDAWYDTKGNNKQFREGSFAMILK